MKSAVQYIIQNCYFAIGDHVFRQVIGIPMGSDPAPFFANLFLFYYEWQWIKKAKKDNIVLARTFHNTFRYIDDLITINNNYFENNIRNIYPAELELKHEGDYGDNNHANFLDLKIDIVNSQFHTSLYDKRDKFNFHIVRMPNKKSNLPQKMFLNTINAEILRICRVTNNFEDFKSTVLKLMSRMKNQGASKTILITSILKLLNRHHSHFAKYNRSSHEILQEIQL